MKSTLVHIAMRYLFVLLFAESALSQQQQMITMMGRYKPFRRVTFSNRSDACAVDAPTVGFTIVADRPGMRPLQPSLRCLSFCNVEPSCFKMNYMADVNQCELFYFQPSRYIYQQNCKHYQVRRLKATQVCQPQSVTHF